MKLTNDQFQILFIVFFSIALSVGFSALYILKKKGYDIYSQKLQFRVICCSAFIVLIPFWINKEATLETKIISSLIGLTIGLLNFLTWERRGEFLRQLLGIKDKTESKKPDEN